VSYLSDWRPQQLRLRSFFAAQDKLFIKVLTLKNVEKFGRILLPPSLIGDTRRQLKIVRPKSGGQNLHLPASPSPSMSFCARHVGVERSGDSF
jgi:hypothetical protein